MKRRTHSPSHEHVLRTLSEFEPMTHNEYSEVSGLHKKAAQSRMTAAHIAGVIYVAAYIRGRSGYPAPAYAIGNAPDSLRPRSMTNKERADKQAERMRKDEKFRKKVRKRQRKYLKDQKEKNTTTYKKRLAYQAKWHREKNGFSPRMPNAAKIDPLLAAIMGVKK